jgi:hypothetical protein
MTKTSEQLRATEQIEHDPFFENIDQQHKSIQKKNGGKKGIGQ